MKFTVVISPCKIQDLAVIWLIVASLRLQGGARCVGGDPVPTCSVWLSGPGLRDSRQFMKVLSTVELVISEFRELAVTERL